MAFLRTYGLLLFCLLSQAKCEIYHITPEVIADDCSRSCITVSQLATSTPFISSNITLIFLPGSHNLTENLTIRSIDYLSIAASNFTAQITCELSTCFAIENVQYAVISDLEFFGCGSNFIRNVTEFVLHDVLFDGCEESGTALQLNETTATLVASTFLSNTHGTLAGDDSLHFLAGGAIFATNTNTVIRDCMFERNRAEVGGAIYADQNSTLSVENTTFVNNQALFQSSTVEPALGMGGVLYQESGSVTITNSLFTNNSAPNFSGGVIYSNKSDVLIKASQFADSTANNGAVIFCYNGSVSIDSSQFNRNAATWGGVIRSSNSDVLIDRSQFSDNRVTMGGGIIDSSGGTVSLNDSQFHSSMATWGGVLYTIEHSKFMISRSQFNGSTATMEGGVFYCNAGDIEIQSSQFYNNSANSPDNEFTQGGVLYLLHGNVHINDSQFYNSAGTYYGGALISISGNVSISSSQFRVHKATNGGAISLFSSNITIEANSQFDGNSADFGGVVYAYNSNITIRDGSEFNNNTASDQGGALSLYECKISINNSNFHWNSVATDGGALYSADGRVDIEGSKFKYNSALNGGAVRVFRSDISLKSTEISSNMATNTAGALYGFFDSNVMILDSILNNNTATVRAGSLYCLRSSIMIQASILNNNTATIAGVLESSNSDITVDDCRMIGNNASIWGGILYTSNSNIVIRNSHVNHSRVNVYNSHGGVFYSINSRVEIYESIFHNNTAIQAGGVMYSRTSNVIVNGSHFSGNIAIFNASVVFTDNGVVTIYDSFLMDNHALVGGVMYANNSNVSVDISQFVGNSALCGGVIDSFLDSNITLERSQFYDNRAESLGAVLRTNRGYFEIRHSQFHNNTCNRRGGVILCIRSQYMIEESQFNENRALDGSVLYTIESSINVHSISIHNNTGDDGTLYLFESTITVSNTSFTSNIGSFLATDTVVNFTNFNSFESCMSAEVDRINFQEGGALTAFQSTIYFEGTTTFDNNQADYGGAIHSTESILNITGTTLVSKNLATRHGGGVFLSQSQVFCQPSSSFRLENNTAWREGGGIYAVGSTISVSIITNETLVNVVGNVARRGGGLALNSNAKLYVLKRMFFKAPVYAVQITDNSAGLGGAFFVSDVSNAASCKSPSTECFLQVLAIHRNEEASIDINTVALFISNNSAKRSASIYGGLLDRCTISPLAEVHSRLPDINFVDYLYNGSGLDYFLDSTEITPDIIVSEAVKVCFCFNGFHNCSHLDPEIRVVKKGEPFVVSVTAVDQVGQPVTGKIQSSLMFTQSGLAEGQLLKEVTDKCSNLTFNVFSSEKNETLTLNANGPCIGADLSMKSVVVQFLPCTCPIGFQPVNINTTCECECHHSISRYVTCDDQTGSIVKQSVNVWISYSNTSGYLVYPNCPYGYCESSDIGTPFTLSQPNGSDAQCSFNRVSTLCSSCEPGLSLSLGGPRCLPCPNYWPALLVVIILAAALAGVALVATLLFLNMTVAVGSLNGIIFYANIVAANRNVFPYETEPGLASVFISFLNLDIGIDTCFFEGMTTYSKTWLQLLFPLYVILLVVLLIVISSYSTKFLNLIGKKDPVATLATLILLSYAKLLGISFTVLSPGTLVYEDGSRQTVWLLDANITYFSGIHVPLFIVAIFILTFGILYTTIVFLWQWIVRLPNKPIFAWTRNQKLQIFIETYNIPYTPHHRYWTGMLLLARVILYLIAAVNVSNDRYLALTSITFIIVCILCLKGLTRGRVFKNWPIDLLETFFYFNILLVAIFTWYVIRPSNALTGNSLAALNASVIMALIVLIFIILYHIYAYTPLLLKLRETKIGKKFDETFKSLSAMSTKKKQHKIETSEDNILLDLVYRPTNAEGYSSTKDSQRSTSHSQPTQSVIDIPVRKPGLEMETNATVLSTISDQDDKESNHFTASSDAKKHVSD